jgi:hypothetical protein
MNDIVCLWVIFNIESVNCTSLIKFIFRYQDLVEIYSVSAEKIINNGKKTIWKYCENLLCGNQMEYWFDVGIHEYSNYLGYVFKSHSYLIINTIN